LLTELPGPTIASGLAVTGEQAVVAGSRVEAGDAESALRIAEEGAIVVAVRAGERDLFRVLVERYHPALVATLVRLVRDRYQAEDLAQQSFVDAFDALARFDTSRRFSTWLFRIAINNAKDWLKSHKRGEQPIDGAVASDAAAFAGTVRGPERQAVANERLDQLSRALDALPVAFREVLVLKDVQGLSYKEIQEILGHPLTTLKIRAVRGRAALRSLMDRE